MLCINLSLSFIPCIACMPVLNSLFLDNRHCDNQKGHAGPEIKYAGPNEFLFGPNT